MGKKGRDKRWKERRRDRKGKRRERGRKGNVAPRPFLNVCIYDAIILLMYVGLCLLYYVGP